MANIVQEDKLCSCELPRCESSLPDCSIEICVKIEGTSNVHVCVCVCVYVWFWPFEVHKIFSFRKLILPKGFLQIIYAAYRPPISKCNINKVLLNWPTNNKAIHQIGIFLQTNIANRTFGKFFIKDIKNLKRKFKKSLKKRTYIFKIWFQKIYNQVQS